MMGQFTDWWRGRSQREQILLGIMIALFLIVFGWLAILRPIEAGLAAAKKDHALAVERLERVRRDASALKSKMVYAADTAQAIVSRSANEAGFSPTRLDPQPGNRVIIALSSAKPIALIKWLKSLDAQGVLVEQISLRPNSDTTLAVDATLRARVK
ncbi:MAG: type II secretion system protein M [Sphingomonadales bacterium]|nr:type II secretion system protein M [Sphingomonadales bacterium]MBK9587973.1 type II secretion system protein M [Sphingomonadales bacterium]